MSSSRVTQRVFAHSSRPEWGRAVVAEELSDRTKYVFENGGERTFMHGPSRLMELELPADECEALAKLLLRQRGPARSSKKKASSAKPKKSEPAITLERQAELFDARFAGGFADPAYVREERGTADQPNIDALIAVAREHLAKDRLDAALASGAFDEVYAGAAKVLDAAKPLAFAKTDRPVFDKIADHSRFALALREVLYGEGPYAPRFDAFAKSLGAKGVPWTIATVFAAAVHPNEHVVVRSTTSQKQARTLGVLEPSIAAPNGEEYAKHLAVAHALRDRLMALGRTPRDLFDVCTFSWRTLGKSAAPVVTAAAAAS